MGTGITGPSWTTALGILGGTHQFWGNPYSMTVLFDSSLERVDWGLYKFGSEGV